MATTPDLPVEPDEGHFISGPYVNRMSERDDESHFVTYLGTMLVIIGVLYLIFINRHKVSISSITPSMYDLKFP